eukprot:5694867-Prymnesium_polylepis.1
MRERCMLLGAHGPALKARTEPDTDAGVRPRRASAAAWTDAAPKEARDFRVLTRARDANAPSRKARRRPCCVRIARARRTLAGRESRWWRRRSPRQRLTMGGHVLRVVWDPSPERGHACVRLTACIGHSLTRGKAHSAVAQVGECPVGVTVDAHACV